MKKKPVVIDVETKYTFRDATDPSKLGITVAGLYDYVNDRSYIFTEKELRELFPFLEQSSFIIGFNVKSFDLPVLAPYYHGDMERFRVFDMLEDIRVKLGRRLALNDILSATLDLKKTGHGLMAINLYREGRWEELKKYCLDDVMLTKSLFDYGAEHGEIFYRNEKGKNAIRVSWKRVLEDEGSSESHLTLPF